MTVGVLPKFEPSDRPNVVSLGKKLLFKEQTHLKDLILKHGGYSPDENLAVYERYFKYAPNRVKHVKRRYGLDRLKVLDIGSSRGEFLVHFGPGSVGLDCDDDRIKFVGRLGYDVRFCNFEEGFPVGEAEFDAAWCSNVLEHVVAPHLLLRRAHKALKDGGLLFVAVPTIPSNRVSEWVLRRTIGWAGYESMEHINAFSRRSLEFMVERAQFDVLGSGVFVSANRLANALAQPLARLAGQTMVVARKSTTRERPWIYPPAWAAGAV